MGQDKIRREKNLRDWQQRKGQSPEAHCYLKGAEKGRSNRETGKEQPVKERKTRNCGVTQA